MSTDLGMPQVRPAHGVGNIVEREPFPDVARRELSNTQLRANLGRATSTIRAKRAHVVGELDDWEDLRDAGSAIKDGIDQSIAQQQLTGADVDACIKGWTDTLALNGLTYDPATQTVTGELTATSSNDAKLPPGVMDLTGDETGNAG